MTPNNIIHGYGYFEGMGRLTFQRRGKCLRYVTPEPVRLKSQRNLIHKLKIRVCLDCLHIVLDNVLRSARN
jgi:hypothetical protein